MQRAKHSWTFLVFCCYIEIIVGAAVLLPVKTDGEAISKGTVDADSTYSANDLDMTGESKEDFSDDKVNIHDRFKRTAVFSDSGYGSRLTAGSNLANDYLALQKVFGNGGPGKRSGADMQFYKLGIYGRPEVLLKRDHGYGSRLRAGDNISRSLLARNSLFGTYGPGRKRSGYYLAPSFRNPEPFFSDKMKDIDQLAATGWLSTNSDLVDDSAEFEGTFGETDGGNGVEKRRLVSDSGYGSRIDAANNVASDLSAVHDVYGIYGPGKRWVHGSAKCLPETGKECVTFLPLILPPANSWTNSYCFLQETFMYHPLCVTDCINI